VRGRGSETHRRRSASARAPPGPGRRAYPPDASSPQGRTSLSLTQRLKTAFPRAPMGLLITRAKTKREREHEGKETRGQLPGFLPPNELVLLLQPAPFPTPTPPSQGARYKRESPDSLSDRREPAGESKRL